MAETQSTVVGGEVSEAVRAAVRQHVGEDGEAVRCDGID